MRRYAFVSAVFFSLLALAQLTRVIFQWSVQVGGLTVPIWPSALALLLAGALAAWGFRVAAASPATT
jgi:hypothetical protein